MGNFCVSLRSFLLGRLFFTGKNVSKTIFEYLKNLFSSICGFWFPVTGFQFFVLDSGFQFLGFRVAPPLKNGSHKNIVAIVGISEHWWNLILSLKATKICNFYHLQYHQSTSTSIRPVMFLSIFNIKLWFEIKLDCLIFSNISEVLLWANYSGKSSQF